MPPRRRRIETPRRRWPLVLLFAGAILAGVALWAYAPILPAEMLISRYANERSQFIDVGGARAHIRDYGRDRDNADTIPVVLIHGSNGSLQVWEGWAREVGLERAPCNLRRSARPRPDRHLAAGRIYRSRPMPISSRC
jgi:hypothetical protein